MTSQACRYCGRQIRWVKTLAGKSMPLDADPSSAGNVKLDKEGRAVVGKAGAKLPGPRFLPHFSTCTRYPGKPKS